MGDQMDPSKLKVAELRQELQDRGLDTRGNKAVLVDRLKEALGSEDNEVRVKQEVDDYDEYDQQQQQGRQNDGEDKVEDKELDDVRSRIKPDPDQDYGYKEGYENAPLQDLKEEQDDGQYRDVKQQPAEVKTEITEEDSRRGQKRKSRSRSRSPEPKRIKPEFYVVYAEHEPEFDENLVTLDWYNSDMSLVIDKESRNSAYPLTIHGFGYVWHGVRASYGYNRGRIFFEVTIVEHINVPHLEADELHPHVIRVGWSTDESGLTLGEEPMGWGYGGTSKASTNLKFKDYGKTFGKGDVVGCFIDMEVEPIVMSFTVNGEHQGICYEISHRQLRDLPLFPHILTKNCSFKINFGDEDPWFTPLTGYVYAGQVPLNDRFRGTLGHLTREEGEVLMMVGLPACGKTTWVEEYCKKNPHKKYNVLGTNNLIDKMKVMGLPRKRNYSGRWDVLIERCTKCLNKLLEMGYKRRRNFIVDQTNVYPSAQKRKMKGFAGFKRRAVVICPSDENLRKRTLKREKEEGKDVPDSAILEMKANFKLPEEGDFFDSVEFIELDREEGTKLIDQYNKEGMDAGFGQKKTFRGNNRRGGGDRRGGQDRDGGGYRGGWDRDRDRRGGFDRRDRGGWNRDRDNTREYSRSGGNYGRDSRGGYNRDRGSYSYNRESRGGGFNRDYGNRDFASRDFGTRDFGNTRDFSRDYNRDFSRDRGNRSGGSTALARSSYTDQGTSLSPSYGSQGGYGGSSSYGSQASTGGGYTGNQGSWAGSSTSSWGTGGNSSGGSQGYGWNQQYYQTQQASYWGGQSGYGGQQSSGYNSGGSGSWSGSTSSNNWSGSSGNQWGGGSSSSGGYGGYGSGGYGSGGYGGRK